MDRIPILRMGQFLLVTIQVDMHDQLAMKLQDDLTGMIDKIGAKGVLVDISALEMVDSFIGRMIANISGMSRILDAQTVLVGMQPAVAITLVELGLSLEGVKTALNVDKGMRMLRKATLSPWSWKTMCPFLALLKCSQPLNLDFAKAALNSSEVVSTSAVTLPFR